MYMHMCLCICMVSICVCVYICVHSYIYTLCCVHTFVCASMSMCVYVFVCICVSVQHFLYPLSQHKAADSWSPTQPPVPISFDAMNFGAPAPNLGRIFMSWTPSLVVFKFLLIRAGIRSLPKTFAG